MFVIVNDSLGPDWAVRIAAMIAERRGVGDSEYQDLSAMRYVLNEHMYGTLEGALGVRDELRKEHDNPDINVYLLVAPGEVERE